MPNVRLARIQRPNPLKVMVSVSPPGGLLLGALTHPRSSIFRSVVPSGSRRGCPMHRQRIYARDFEVPSALGVGTARAIAKAYGVFAHRRPRARPRPGHHRRSSPRPRCRRARPLRDAYLDGGDPDLAGLHGRAAAWSFGGTAAYGTAGIGGSLGFADPETGIGYAYVTNRMGTHLTGDPREVALRDAVSACL